MCVAGIPASPSRISSAKNATLPKTWGCFRGRGLAAVKQLRRYESEGEATAAMTLFENFTRGAGGPVTRRIFTTAEGPIATSPLIQSD
jgi:hypothetical protein